MSALGRCCRKSQPMSAPPAEMSNNKVRNHPYLNQYFLNAGLFLKCSSSRRCQKSFFDSIGHSRHIRDVRAMSVRCPLRCQLRTFRRLAATGVQDHFQTHAPRHNRRDTNRKTASLAPVSLKSDQVLRLAAAVRLPSLRPGRRSFRSTAQVSLPLSSVSPSPRPVASGIWPAIGPRAGSLSS